MHISIDDLKTQSSSVHYLIKCVIINEKLLARQNQRYIVQPQLGLCNLLSLINFRCGVRQYANKPSERVE